MLWQSIVNTNSVLRSYWRHIYFLDKFYMRTPYITLHIIFEWCAIDVVSIAKMTWCSLHPKLWTRYPVTRQWTKCQCMKWNSNTAVNIAIFNCNRTYGATAFIHFTQHMCFFTWLITSDSHAYQLKKLRKCLKVSSVSRYPYQNQLKPIVFTWVGDIVTIHPSDSLNARLGINHNNMSPFRLFACQPYRRGRMFILEVSIY